MTNKSIFSIIPFLAIQALTLGSRADIKSVNDKLHERIAAGYEGWTPNVDKTLYSTDFQGLSIALGYRAKVEKSILQEVAREYT